MLMSGPQVRCTTSGNLQKSCEMRIVGQYLGTFTSHGVPTRKTIQNQYTDDGDIVQLSDELEIDTEGDYRSYDLQGNEIDCCRTEEL